MDLKKAYNYIKIKKDAGGDKMLKSNKGQGMVEYGLIIALIAIVVLVALTPVGGAVSDIFTQITGAL